MGKITESALELVGKTPLLRASRYAKTLEQSRQMF